MKSTLILVGGFLGAGKTSLLWEMAKRLQEQGEAVGLITNDQASELVDTAFLKTSADIVTEVSGSCFCCNFNGFADAIAYIRQKNNDGIILAEPVGSCTDLSATILQPLKDKYADSVELKPLTVLCDPFQLAEILKDASSPSQYIVHKQFEEADILLINKSDLLGADELNALKAAAAERYPHATVLTASAKSGEGLQEWYDTLMRSHTAGANMAEVDYDIYADGEAAFGWLNASFALDACAEPDAAAENFLRALGKQFDQANANVGHVKFLLRHPDGLIIGNLTGRIGTAMLRKLAHGSANAALTVNARVEMGPDELQSIVLEEVERAFGGMGCRQTALKCLIPGRPNPTYRYDWVV
jgi:G3E family GTPase